jgi:threonine synthase
MDNPTPLVQAGPIAGFANVYVKDESLHPSGTFKDRLTSTAVDTVPDRSVITTISYANTAASLAHALSTRPSARAKHLEGCVLVPEDLASWTLGPSTSGAMLAGDDLLRYLEKHLEVVALPTGGPILDDVGVAEFARAALPNARHVENITEGLTTPCYRAIAEEAVAQLGRAPDICLVPYGAGILCNEMVDYLAEWECRSPDRTGAIREPYWVHAIGEEEILAGLEMARSIGISAEPSGAVGLGVLPRLESLSARARPDAIVLVINTGNGIDTLLSRLGVGA